MANNAEKPALFRQLQNFALQRHRLDGKNDSTADYISHVLANGATSDDLTNFRTISRNELNSGYRSEIIGIRQLAILEALLAHQQEQTKVLQEMSASLEKMVEILTCTPGYRAASEAKQDFSELCDKQIR